MNAKVLLDYLKEFENPEDVELCFGIVDGKSGEWYDLEIDIESTINGNNNEYVIELKENKKYLKDKLGFPFDKLAELIDCADEVFKELKDEYYN